MEIALNIIWLLLIVPAVWVYRRQEPGRVDQSRRFARLAPLLVLSCVIVLLFPVISASDDLHAMRFEMEEPGAQRWVKQLAGSQACSVFQSGSALIRASSTMCGQRNDSVCGQVSLFAPSLFAEATVSEFASRAPPLPFLG